MRFEHLGVLKPFLGLSVASRGSCAEPPGWLRRSIQGVSCFFLALLILAANVRPVQAAPPPNDTCNGAEIIPSNASFPYLTAITDISEATSYQDPPTPSCVFGDVSHSIWYKFIPRDTAFYTISSCTDAPTGTSVPDTVMAIYNSTVGCAGATNELPSNGTSLGCDDDSCGPGFTQASITTQLLLGNTYFIVVWQSGTQPALPGHSAVQLRIWKALPPRNDTALGAEELFVNRPVLGTTILAKDDYELASPDCFSGVKQRPSTAIGRDVVYTFTAPAAGDYSIKADHYNNSSVYDLVLYAAASIPAGPPPVAVTDCLAAANRNPASSAEEILCLPLAVDQKIYIFVDEDQFTPQGSTFSIEVRQCVRESESNGTWIAATPLSFGMEGSIAPANDIDFYSLGLFSAGSRLFAMVDGSAANITDFQMRAISISADSTNTLEYDYGNNDDLFGGLSSNLAGTRLTEAPAFLRINHLPYTTAEPYRLYAVVQPPMSAATVETEPNDTPQQANLAGNNYFYGSLAPPVPPRILSSDADVYGFSVDTLNGVSDLIFLSLDCDPLRDNTPINGKLELLDQAGNVLVVVDDENSSSSTTATTGSLIATSPFSPGEALVYRALSNGTYYARVSISPNANAASGSGDYLLSISKNGFLGDCGCNTPPSLANLTLTPSIYQQWPATLTGNILDYDIGQTHQVIINWGDGSSATTTNLPAGVTSFSLSHTYIKSSSNLPLTVLLWDDQAGIASTNLAVTVQPEPVSPRLISITPTNGYMLLQLSGSPGVTYRVQTSPGSDLWSDYASVVADQDGLLQIEDTTSPVPSQRFYRGIWP